MNGPRFLDADTGTDSKSTVDIFIGFKNAEENHLGIPLPAGRVRVYKLDSADGSREFIGENVIAHTPKDEPVRVRIGTAFDLIGDRTQTSFKADKGTQVMTESFEIAVRNHRPEAADVMITEHLYRWRNWEIKESSDKWQKVDARTIQFPVTIPANGEKKVTYSVEYSW